ncbi:hypothetical protein AMTR_s00052p00217200 [Amborella trichopoda]|uniref:Uncharacterized protein n=1 Tax=Amborella trichopoda TaxID=13333 RepID=U5D226_AMBTC|nr:hypothetical protein AMTR_s00052p00217200 [Amborella trichopoda]
MQHLALLLTCFDNITTCSTRLALSSLIIYFISPTKIELLITMRVSHSTREIYDNGNWDPWISSNTIAMTIIIALINMHCDYTGCSPTPSHVFSAFSCSLFVSLVVLTFGSSGTGTRLSHYFPLLGRKSWRRWGSIFVHSVWIGYLGHTSLTFEVDFMGLFASCFVMVCAAKFQYTCIISRNGFKRATSVEKPENDDLVRMKCHISASEKPFEKNKM